MDENFSFSSGVVLPKSTVMKGEKEVLRCVAIKRPERFGASGNRKNFVPDTMVQFMLWLG